MAKLTEEMKGLVNKGLVFISTVDEKGMPNVAPKGSVRVSGDETITFVEGYGKKTFENLKRNPKVTAVVVNRETRDGYQFKGTSLLITEGPEFEEAKKEGEERGRPPLKALVRINVEEIYDLKPGPTAGERLV